MIIKNKSGATLIELLAVVSIMTFVLVIITSSLGIWFNNTNNIPRKTLNQEQLRFAFERIVKDVEQAGNIVFDVANGVDQTLLFDITKSSGEHVIYQYDVDDNILYVSQDGITLSLVENITSFIVDYEDNIYYIEGKLEDIDLKTGQPYTLTTNAIQIIW